MRRSCPIGILLCLALSSFGQSKDGVDTLKTQEINEVTVTAHKSGRMKANTVGNMELISSKELLRAACCNLGESFTTNPLSM